MLESGPYHYENLSLKMTLKNHSYCEIPYWYRRKDSNALICLNFSYLIGTI